MEIFNLKGWNST